KTGGRRIFCSCTTAHGHSRTTLFLLWNLFVGIDDSMPQFTRESSALKQRTAFSSNIRKILQGFVIQPIKNFLEPGRKGIERKKVVKSIRSDRKTIGNVHTKRCQRRYHLAERGVFPADLFEVPHGNLLKWDDVLSHN